MCWRSGIECGCDYRDLEDADIVTRWSAGHPGFPLSALEGAVEGGAEVVNQRAPYCIGCRSRNCTRLPGVVTGDRATEMVRLLEGVGTLRGPAANGNGYVVASGADSWLGRGLSTAGYYVDALRFRKMLRRRGSTASPSPAAARAFQRDGTRRNALRPPPAGR